MGTWVQVALGDLQAPTEFTASTSVADAKLSSRVLVTIHTLASVLEVSLCPTSLPILGIKFFKISRRVCVKS